MPLTHIDCQFHRGEGASADTSSYVALNPTLTPGSLLLAGSSAARGSIGSQVACRLALEHFVEGVVEFFEAAGRRASAGGAFGHPEISVEVLEAAFKKANRSVYSFGHKLAAGGRMAASLLGLVIQDSLIAAGRVGAGSAYLHRQGELFPFFEARESGAADFVGSNSLVAVELASIPVEPADSVLAFSCRLRDEQEAGLRSQLAGADLGRAGALRELVSGLWSDPREPGFALAAQLGPQTIYLAQAVSG